MQRPVLATAWRVLSEPLASIGRPAPLHALRLRRGDVHTFQVRKIEEFMFHCELTWQKPGGERGMVQMAAEVTQTVELARWLRRAFPVPDDLASQLWNHPVGGGPIVDFAVNKP